MTMMRAAVYRSFSGPITVESTVPHPTAPHDGVVIKVMATGVCRSDWHGWKGHDGDIKEHGLPFVPGHEASGVIVDVGPEVTRFKVGDRVAVPFILSCGRCDTCARRGRPTICERQEQPGFTMMGSFAEFCALPRADRNLCVIPPSVSFVEAAALGCRFTTAYRAVVQQGGLNGVTRAARETSVAVFGCGGLGLSCVMIAAAYGARKIIAVDLSDGALEKAREVGATDTVNAREEDARQRVTEITNGAGADLTIDAAGFKDTCEDAIHCAKGGGRMVQVGLPIGGRNDPIVPMGLVAGRELEIVGSHGCAAEDLPAILSMVGDGRLDPLKLIGREVTLEEGARALMDMDHGSPVGMTMITQFSDVPLSRY